MVRLGLLESNKHKKWCYAAETSPEVYIWKLHSALHNNSTHFEK